jgi:hypothetical protein
MTDEERAERFGWWWKANRISDGLRKRFGWWWDPSKALRGAFSDRSAEAIRNGVWLRLERAAFNYELASRHNGRRKYVLGKRFDRLTEKQMLQLAKLWPRKPRALRAPIFFPEYVNHPELIATWHDFEINKGWTVPRYFTLNLAEW